LLAEQQLTCWQQWRQLAEGISASRQRRALLTGVLADQRRLGRSAWWRSYWSWAKGWISA
jgi:hypothetical protein